MDKINIKLEKGETLSLQCPDLGSVAVADWLCDHGVELNLRCGRKELCRGCEVWVGKEVFKACCLTCSELLEKLDSSDACGEVPVALWIPVTSQKQQLLHGVSVFDFDLHPLPGPVSGEGLLLALDIGTTTVAGALWKNETQELLVHGSVANAQRRFGDDVVSRVESAMESPDRAGKLQQAVVQQSILPLVERLCIQAGIEIGEIREGMVAGNTVMLHSLFGASLSGFGAYPFTPEFLDAQRISGAQLGADALSHLFFRTPPCLGPFVGADIVAGALASGMLACDEVSLLVDFGTNGEMLLKVKNKYFATATAAGPAFEGGRLKWGAAAGNKVVSEVTLTKDHFLQSWGSDGELLTDPRGISGAAYLQLISLLLEVEAINIMGRMDASHPLVESILDEDGSPELCVKLGGDVYLNEPDIAEIMQAKGAIAAGVLSICERAGVDLETLDRLYVAGGFGYHLNLHAAELLGLIPPLPADRIRVVGNSSLAGASICGFCDCDAVMDRLRRNCEVLELNQLATFQDHFIDCMCLQPMGL